MENILISIPLAYYIAYEEVGACCVPPPAHVASLNPERYRPSQQYEQFSKPRSRNSGSNPKEAFCRCNSLPVRPGGTRDGWGGAVRVGASPLYVCFRCVITDYASVIQQVRRSSGPRMRSVFRLTFPSALLQHKYKKRTSIVVSSAFVGDRGGVLNIFTGNGHGYSIITSYPYYE